MTRSKKNHLILSIITSSYKIQTTTFREKLYIQVLHWLYVIDYKSDKWDGIIKYNYLDKLDIFSEH